MTTIDNNRLILANDMDSKKLYQGMAHEHIWEVELGLDRDYWVCKLCGVKAK